ncbi:hypothetical protein D3C75_683360 [compost metagenome]
MLGDGDSAHAGDINRGESRCVIGAVNREFNNAQIIVVAIRRTAKQGVENRAVFRGGDIHIRHRRRGVGHRDRDRRDFGDATAGDGVGEGIFADITRIRRINQLVIHNTHRTMRRHAGAGDGGIGITETVVV